LDARDNIWKAYVYTETSLASHGMLVLKAGNTEVTPDFGERDQADIYQHARSVVILERVCIKENESIVKT
jgi:hypothetical protein